MEGWKGGGKKCERRGRKRQGFDSFLRCSGYNLIRCEEDGEVAGVGGVGGFYREYENEGNK